MYTHTVLRAVTGQWYSRGPGVSRGGGGGSGVYTHTVLRAVKGQWVVLQPRRPGCPCGKTSDFRPTGHVSALYRRSGQAILEEMQCAHDRTERIVWDAPVFPSLAKAGSECYYRLQDLTVRFRRSVARSLLQQLLWLSLLGFDLDSDSKEKEHKKKKRKKVTS